MNTVTQSKLTRRPLGEVARFLRGITFKPEDIVDLGTEDSVVCMRTKNVQADLDQSDLIAVPSQFVKRDELYLRESDILVSTANSWNLVGKCAWVPNLDYNATAGGFISILRANAAKVAPRYLYYWFNSAATQHSVRLCGRQTTNISNMNFERCEALEIPLPPLSEQKRIADILDKADAIRRKRQEAISIVDGELLKSAFRDHFGDPRTNPKGWPIEQLGNVINFVGGSQPPKETFINEPRPGYVRLVQIRDFKTDKYPTYIPKELAKRPFVKDDVMIARYGPPVFQILRGLEGSYNVALMKAENTERTTKEFIFYLLQIPEIHDVVVANSQRTAGQSGTNLMLLKSLEMPIPPIEKQIEIATILKSIEVYHTTAQSYLHAAEELFSSVVQRAFKGGL